MPRHEEAGGVEPWLTLAVLEHIDRPRTILWMALERSVVHIEPALLVDPRSERSQLEAIGQIGGTGKRELPANLTQLPLLLEPHPLQSLDVVALKGPHSNRTGAATARLGDSGLDQLLNVPPLAAHGMQGDLDRTRVGLRRVSDGDVGDDFSVDLAYEATAIGFGLEEIEVLVFPDRPVTVGLGHHIEEGFECRQVSSRIYRSQFQHAAKLAQRVRAPDICRIHSGNMASTGLVLGGGGVTGAAYEMAALMAIELATGWNPNHADVVVGTSAGSFVTALLRNDRLMVDSLVDPGESREDVAARISKRLFSRAGLSGVSGWVRHGIIPSLRKPGLTAFLGSPAPFVASGLKEWVEARVGADRAASWPDRPTVITAYDLESKERVAFGTQDAPDVSIADAVAASSAIPILFRPWQIDGRHYVDGGVVSGTHADLVLGSEKPLDLLIVIAPMAAEEQRDRAWFHERIFDRVGTNALRRELAEIKRGLARHRRDRARTEPAGVVSDATQPARSEGGCSHVHQDADRHAPPPCAARRLVAARTTLGHRTRPHPDPPDDLLRSPDPTSQW